MQIDVKHVEYAYIEPIRELYRLQNPCQIVHDSMLRRGLADAFLITANGKTAGYGGVFNKHYPGRVMEYYVVPHWLQEEWRLFRALVESTSATELEAQTNMPRMLTMLYDCARDITVENILFEDQVTTHLFCEGAVFRHGRALDGVGDEEYVVEFDGAIAASGGVLFHYNPPYGDIYMQTGEAHRRRGFGSFLVQELKVIAYEGGHKPAARCNPDNIASRLTLQRAGMMPCGRLLAGKLVTK